MICIRLIKFITKTIFYSNYSNRNSSNRRRRGKESEIQKLAQDILGISQETSSKDIRKAYLSLMKKYHPDNHHTENSYVKMEMEEKSKLINWAYNELKNR